MTRLLWSVALLGALGCTPEYEEAEPPLRTLVYTEVPGHDNEQAAELETHLLRVFEGSGSIPTVSESAEIIASLERTQAQVEGSGPEAMLDELVPKPEGEEASENGAQEIEPAAPVDEKGSALGARSPETLAVKAFEAMVGQDADLFDRVLINTDGLMKLAKIKRPTARLRARSLRKAAAKAYGVFAPKIPSEAPQGGLATKVTLLKSKIGKAGTIWGKAPKEDEDVVQHWGNLLTFKLNAVQEAKAEPILFTISLGRMLKTPDGRWFLASAPEVSSRFKAYLAGGFHLKPELMQPEHHPFPLSVGNFWRYRIKRHATEAQDEAPKEVAREEILIEVIDVDRRDGYRVVSLRRTRKKGESTTRDSLHYLVTPKRLYTCSSYCKYKSKDVGYLLGYARTQTPALLFPLKTGLSWSLGGSITTRNARYLVREKTEIVNVPAGEFSNALVIAGRRSHSYITRYFKPGVGVIQRVIRSANSTRIEELVEYRILTAE